jgi:hypothetical protein
MEPLARRVCRGAPECLAFHRGVADVPTVVVQRQRRPAPRASLVRMLAALPQRIGATTDLLYEPVGWMSFEVSQPLRAREKRNL